VVVALRLLPYVSLDCMFDETYIMKKKTKITLGPHFEKLIKRKVNSGRYKSTGDVIRSSLRHFERHENRYHSDDDEDFDPIAFMQQVEQELELERELNEKERRRNSF
tara:strand:+ start:204 stop:524 length:321 start_codon:yes stop_codon:yes gene_type:complete